MKEREFYISRSLVQAGEQDDKKTISGYAVRFNELSRKLHDPFRNVWFYEKIAPEAITEDLIKRSDIFLTYNHDVSNFLARSRNGEGTLHLEIRDDGLFFSFEVPDTSFGNDIYTKIKRGEIDECSFWGRVSEDPDAEIWEEKNGEYYKTIRKLEILYDCCVCPVGAYGTTSVIARNIDNFSNIVDDLEAKINKITRSVDITILNNMDAKDIITRMNENKQILSDCEKEKRSMTEDEAKKFDENLKVLNSVNEETEKKEEETQEADNQEVKQEEAETKEEKQEAEDVETDSEEKEEEKRSLEDEEKQEEAEENKEEKTEEKETDEKEEEVDDKDNKRNLQNTKKHNTSNMKDNFSIVRALRNAVNKNAQDEISAAVISAGKEDLKRSGLNVGNFDIVIPTVKRAIQVTGEDGTHDAVIDTDFLNILDPLTSKNILSQLGVTVMSDLVNDIKIPYGSSIEARFAGETAKVNASNATFDYIVMKPKRLACVVPISMQQLAQDSIGVETFVRKQIVKAIMNKIEEIVFSDTKAGDEIIGGLLAEGNSTEGVEVTNFAKLCENEALIEDNNFYGSFKYAATPKAKAALRAMQYGGKTTAMVFQGGEVDGTPLVSSSVVGDAKQYFVGDWSTVILANWGSVFVKVDDVTLADEGIVRLIINTFWDVAYTRPEAIVAANIGE